MSRPERPVLTTTVVAEVFCSQVAGTLYGNQKALASFTRALFYPRYFLSGSNRERWRNRRNAFSLI